MSELDVVRVKETVTVTAIIVDLPVEIKAGWEGTIVADADTSTPMVEFNDYGPNSVLANLDSGNLEVIWESR